MGLFKRKQVSRFYFLRNDELVVYINNQGAELMSVKDASSGLLDSTVALPLSGTRRTECTDIPA